jgi:hypothetical protein
MSSTPSPAVRVPWFARVRSPALTGLLLAVLLVRARTAAAIEPQVGTNWCWCACVQDMLRKAGIEQTQPQIAARLDGWPMDRPANTVEVVLLLRSYGLKAEPLGRAAAPGELRSWFQRRLGVIAQIYPDPGSEIGHSVVLEGLDPCGNVLVSDPATGVTSACTLAQLYHGLNWRGVIVVGR